MQLRTVVRDCLFLNWALPAASLPAPPAPLRFQRHEWQGEEYVFASALLFHHDAVRWRAFPLLRVGYPQLNVRLYVLDGEGVPSVWFLHELMPAWVAPAVRLISRHPVAAAHLDFPRPSRQAEDGSWHWRARRDGAGFGVRAAVHSPAVGEGPRLGGWDDTVSYMLERPRGYARHSGELVRVHASHPPAQGVWPLAAELDGDRSLLDRLLPGAPAPALHSSWLCPEMPFSIAFDRVPRVHAVVNGMPHPAAGRVSGAVLNAGQAGDGVAAATAVAVAAAAGAGAGGETGNLRSSRAVLASAA